MFDIIGRRRAATFKLLRRSQATIPSACDHIAAPGYLPGRGNRVHPKNIPKLVQGPQSGIRKPAEKSLRKSWNEARLPLIDNAFFTT